MGLAWDAVSAPQTLTTRLRHESAPTKRSRFLVTAAPVDTEAAARVLLAEVSAEMADASHHCWAWRIAQPAIDRAGDDGEPSGSAGRPILAQLIGRDLVNTAVVVTRYFGGTKLGVGGLIRAYGGAAGEALDTATLTEWQATLTVEVVHQHRDTSAVNHCLQTVSATEIDVVYTDRVTRSIKLAINTVDELRNCLLDATAGRVTVDDADWLPIGDSPDTQPPQAGHPS